MAKFSGILSSIDASAPLLARFGALLENAFLFGIGAKILPILDRLGGAIFGLGMPL